MRWAVAAACGLGCVLLAHMIGVPPTAWTAATIAAGGLLLSLTALLATSRLGAGRALDAEALYRLTPAEFERYVANVFAASGYAVRVVGGSGDGGVDVRVWRDGWSGIVQCKRYRPDRTLGPAAVRELIGTRSHERARHAWLATTATLSPAARSLARDEGVVVLDARALSARIHGGAWRPARAWQLGGR